MYNYIMWSICKQKRQRTPRKPSIHATFIYSVQKYIKRSGMEDTFDIKKIEAAIRKANESVIVYEKLTEENLLVISLLTSPAI